MARELIAFKSNGVEIKGHFYKPEGIKPPYPCVVMGGGWCYVKELIQPEYAGFFVKAAAAADMPPRSGRTCPWGQVYHRIPS